MKYIFLTLLALFLTACGGGGGSASAPEEVKTYLLATGDSTMEGGSPNIPTTWGKLLGVKVENIAVSGTQLWQLIAGQDGRNPALSEVLKSRPDVRYVTENFGINEAWRFTDTAVYEKSLRDFVYTVRSAGKTPILISPNPVYFQGVDHQEAFAKVLEAVRKVATEEGVLFIDTHARFLGTPTEEYLDGIHPGQALYDKIAAYEAEELKKLIVLP